MKRIIWCSAIVCATLLGVTSESHAQEKGKQNEGVSSERSPLDKQQEQSKVSYYCPMHPEVVSNKAGKCPKCGMNLEKKESTGSKVKSEMKMDSMCAEMCMMMMNDPAMMKMMHPPKADMMGGMGDMKEMKDKPDDAMRMKAMSVRTPSEEKMKSCCGMMKSK